MSSLSLVRKNVTFPGRRSVVSHIILPPTKLSSGSQHATAPKHPVAGAASSYEQAEGAFALPEKRCVIGLGGAGIDYLAEVAAYPAPDDKIRSTDLQVAPGPASPLPPSYSLRQASIACHRHTCFPVTVL